MQSEAMKQEEIEAVAREMAKGVKTSISLMWRRYWPNLITIFDYPPEIRNVIYATNAIESLNSVIRKLVRNENFFRVTRRH